MSSATFHFLRENTHLTGVSYLQLPLCMTAVSGCKYLLKYKKRTIDTKMARQSSCRSGEVSAVHSCKTDNLTQQTDTHIHFQKSPLWGQSYGVECIMIASALGLTFFRLSAWELAHWPRDKCGLKPLWFPCSSKVVSVKSGKALSKAACKLCRPWPSGCRTSVQLLECLKKSTVLRVTCNKILSSSNSCLDNLESLNSVTEANSRVILHQQTALCCWSQWCTSSSWVIQN